nr:ABC transporter ATP-binding protein [Bacteroidota bacterium]
MKPEILNTTNLAIGYHGRTGAILIQEQLNLELPEGKMICLLGRNGSGKSTLIRTLSGFQPALKGKVNIGGKNLENILPNDLSKLVSVVLTTQPELSGLTVFAVVAFGRSPYTGFLGKLSKTDYTKVEQALESAGILHLNDKRFDQLSDGERQKVMIAKSLAQETPIIFLDEPTAYLDYPAKVDIIRLLLQSTRNNNKSVLMSTHDLNLALSFADRIWLMAKDKPVKTGIPEDLVLSDDFTEYFSGSNTSFDKLTGTFIFEPEKAGHVCVEGMGLKYDWLVRALKRQGYEIQGSIPDIPPPHVPVIKIFDDRFEINVFGQTSIAHTIEEVLNKITIQ